ncbi:MAG: hypothetical protein J6C92_12800 [Bacteroidaceae bacterium]|nr:hypothetical protein [Bacteroidaceae bacterium]
MGTEIIEGYNSEKARNAIEFYLDFGMMCTVKNGNEKHAIMTINNYLRIRFKYEGMKREYIEIKELKKKTNKIITMSRNKWELELFNKSD